MPSLAAAGADVALIPELALPAERSDGAVVASLITPPPGPPRLWSPPWWPARGLCRHGETYAAGAKKERR
ncbi:hypothetical protein ABZ611_18925 [Streptomyces sp. NPDC007861]|uniref:hypothetical protein n=1 Tax=Streptomyces sp. NPDC007861 TaxID=3154893 RepID=UPI0033C6A5B2